MSNKDSHVIQPSLSENAVYNDLRVEMTQSRTLNDFSQCIHKQVKALGFTDFLFLRLDRCWQAAPQRGLLSSLPPAWLKCYQEDKLHEVDLVLSYCKDNVKPIFSSQIYGYMSDAPFNLSFIDDSRRILQLYRRWGFAEHLVVPMQACSGQSHVALLLGSLDSMPRKFRAMAGPVMSSCQALCKAIDWVSTERFYSSFIQQRSQSLVSVHKVLQGIERWIKRRVRA